MFGWCFLVLHRVSHISPCLLCYHSLNIHYCFFFSVCLFSDGFQEALFQLHFTMAFCHFINVFQCLDLVRMFLQFCWWNKILLMVFWRSFETSSSFLFVSDHGFTGLGCIPQGLFSVFVFLFSLISSDWDVRFQYLP